MSTKLTIVNQISFLVYTLYITQPIQFGELTY